MSKIYKSPHLIVVAIDFGTTYSGYAFSFKSTPKKIHTNNSWSQHLISLKTPTSILLNPDRQFDSFGYDAESKYGRLLEDDEGDGWALFRKFKMVLYDNPDLSDQTEVSDISNTVKMPAVRIFAMAIRYLKEHVIGMLNMGKRGRGRYNEIDIDEKDIFFVLTVPAIWDDRAKRLMREASVEAGIAGDRLGMALESEAASIWCQTVPLLSGGKSCNIQQPGDVYMVVDLGGGTADITIHEVMRQGRVKELDRASGGDWGGTQVDKHFISMITQVMGKETMQQFGRECLSDLFDLLREFEVTKRTISPTSSGKISIKLPSSLHEIRKEHKRGMDERASFLHTMKGSTFGDKVVIKGDKLRIDADLARDMFQYSIGGLCEHMRRLLHRMELGNDVPILFVGGFSECSLIQDAMFTQFPNRNLIFPPEGGLAVLKGAVMYGHQPGVVAVRRARFTYGLKATVDFNPDIHPASAKKMMGGSEKCPDSFRKYVEVGQEVTSGYTVTEMGMPASEDQHVIVYYMYMSTDPAPVLVSDPTCTLLGQFQVKLPKGKTREERAFETSVVFGETEIMVKVRHVKSGDAFTKYFNFL